MGVGEKELGFYMLPVEEGDCFYLQLPCPNGRVFRLMIDCGPTSSWDKAVKPFFMELKKRQLRIDLLIITHMDADHIGGALRLFQDETLRTLVSQVWFNGLRQIAPRTEREEASAKTKAVYARLASSCQVNLIQPEEQVSAKQAQMLSELLEETGVLWNGSQNCAIGTGTPSYEIAPGIRIDILLPTEQALRNLYRQFASRVQAVRAGTPVVVAPESERAFELALYCGQEAVHTSQSVSYSMEAPEDVQSWAAATAAPDRSVPNGSSITVCIRYFEKRLLFPGDAIAKDLVEALKAWGDPEAGEEAQWFDVLKLPHHGAAGNCLDLLDHLDGACFLVSTDGRKFGHPDKETIAKLISRPLSASGSRKLIFNYPNAAYRLFAKPELEQRYGYQAILSDGWEPLKEYHDAELDL